MDAVIDTVYILLICGLVALGIFVLTLIWRIAVALERSTRHLFEIAKDVKKLSIHFREEREDHYPVSVKKREDEE